MKHLLPPIPTDAARDARLAAYRGLLIRWNATINLIARGEEREIDHRHLADSLQLLPLLPRDGALADLGSGAGLPGMVLAAACPERDVHLVESDRRKAAFLIEAAATLHLPRVKVHAARIEAVTLPPLTAVTARALAPLSVLLPMAAKFLTPGGVALFPKGRGVEQELTKAAAGWHFRVERFQSRTDPDATILRLSEIRRAGE